MKAYFFGMRIFFTLVVWSNLFAYDIPKDYKQIECVIKPSTRRSENISHPHIPGPARPEKDKTAQETSTNWGGYVAVTSSDNPAENAVTAVYGSWIVPSIKPSSIDTYSVIFIGIDGYSSPTVEQIGTGHDYVNGVQQHYAWFEMYPRPSYEITNFPVRPGDVITASVEYAGDDVFVLSLYNNTRKVFVTVPTSYTTMSGTKRQSAEWIIEAPYWNGILPLTNFSTAYMWGCIANINGVLGLVNSDQWQHSRLKMVTKRGFTKAKPSALLQDGGSFFVQWRHV